MPGADAALRRLYADGGESRSLLYRGLRSSSRRTNPEAAHSMLDLLSAALGFGGILAMAAYAALCDRI